MEELKVSINKIRFPLSLIKWLFTLEKKHKVKYHLEIDGENFGLIRPGQSKTVKIQNKPHRIILNTDIDLMVQTDVLTDEKYSELHFDHDFWQPKLSGFNGCQVLKSETYKKSTNTLLDWFDKRFKGYQEVIEHEKNRKLAHDQFKDSKIFYSSTIINNRIFSDNQFCILNQKGEFYFYPHEKEFNIRDIINIEVIVEGTHSNGITGTLTGGLMFGGVGALIGNLATKGNKVSSISIEFNLDSYENPRFRFDFLKAEYSYRNKSPMKLKSKHQTVQNAQNELKNFLSYMAVIDKHENTSKLAYSLKGMSSENQN